MSTSENQIGPTNLEIDEVTTSASLSTDTSPITENIAPLNPRINLGKYEHPSQVGDHRRLAVDGHVTYH